MNDYDVIVIGRALGERCIGALAAAFYLVDVRIQQI